MSHFTCLVVTDENPTTEVLSQTLMPWHEFECTGLDNEYVVDVDETEKLRDEWREGTTRRYVDPDGVHHDPYDDRFYRDPTPAEQEQKGQFLRTGFGGGLSWHSRDWGDGRGYRAKIHFLPNGWEEIDVPTPEVQTFRHWVVDWTERPQVLPGGHEKYGFIEVTGLGPSGEVIRVVDRTNPNKRWDWWAVGGRWPDRLTMKNGRRCDQCRLSDLDLEGMRTTRITERRGYVRDAIGKVGLAMGEAEEIWKRYVPALAAERKAWNAARHEGTPVAWAAWIDALPKDHVVYEANRTHRLVRELDDYGVPEDAPDLSEWIESPPAITSHAYVLNGEWHERGEMGWWAVVHDPQQRTKWEDEVSDMVAGLRPDQWLSVVDCHI